MIIAAWLYPDEGVSLEAELRKEFLDWAGKRPDHLRSIRDGTTLFRVFAEEFART